MLQYLGCKQHKGSRFVTPELKICKYRGTFTLLSGFRKACFPPSRTVSLHPRACQAFTFSSTTVMVVPAMRKAFSAAKSPVTCSFLWLHSMVSAQCFRRVRCLFAKRENTKGAVRPTLTSQLGLQSTHRGSASFSHTALL